MQTENYRYKPIRKYSTIYKGIWLNQPAVFKFIVNANDDYTTNSPGPWEFYCQRMFYESHKKLIEKPLGYFFVKIGDKTFFIAAILAMRNNKLTVFMAAISALFGMTVLSGLLGWVVTTFIPR